MSFWVKVSGYMTIKPVFPDTIGEKHKGDDDWTRDVCDDIHSWIAQLLPDNRERFWRKKRNLADSFYIKWTKGDDEFQDEEFVIPQEDIEKLSFPSGSDSPLDLTISVNLSAYQGLTYHVVFGGNLRDVYSVKEVVEWWRTIKKYLTVADGHFFASSETEYFEDSIHKHPWGSDAKDGKKLYDIESDKREEDTGRISDNDSDVFTTC